MFQLSGTNIATETDKYESSVYMTPELNPQLDDTLKANTNGSNPEGTPMDAVKSLDYRSEPKQETMSTMAKARPADQGSDSDENVQDSNDSDYYAEEMRD